MELLVYKASAGSGKTFTLAVEYIKLLILNPRAYRQILAVTFTNKATAEMKERILSQLYGIWKGDKDSDAYLKRIIAETGKPVEEVLGSVTFKLPYCAELAAQSLAGDLLADLSLRESKGFRKAIEAISREVFGC